jgi:aspartate/tyrosine/aromatic aminotransferase
LGGHASFLKGAQKLALGDELYAEKSAEGKVGSLQTLSGTGALYVAGTMYSKFSPVKKALISNPTWGNHNAIFTNCGLEVSKYRYIDESCMSTPKLDLSGFLEDLEAADEGTLVLLQACAHNPTGVDPSEEEVRSVATS